MKPTVPLAAPRVLKTWPEKTQQEIAEQVGCSQALVHKVKDELITRDKLDLPDTRMGRDGKERPTTYARREPEQIVDTPPMPLWHCTRRVVPRTAPNPIQYPPGDVRRL